MSSTERCVSPTATSIDCSTLPEAVGLSYTHVLAAALFPTAVILLAMLGVFFLSDDRPRCIREKPGSIRERPFHRSIPIWALFAVALLAQGGQAYHGGSFGIAFYAVVAVPIFGMAGALPLIASSGWPLANVPRRLQLGATELWVVAAVTVVTIFTIANSAGRAYAIDVQHGRASVSDTRFALALDTPSVAVNWIGPGSEPDFLTHSYEFVYLGEANGVTVLYAADNGITIRVPTHTVVLNHFVANPLPRPHSHVPSTPPSSLPTSAPKPTTPPRFTP